MSHLLWLELHFDKSLEQFCPVIMDSLACSFWVCCKVSLHFKTLYICVQPLCAQHLWSSSVLTSWNPRRNWLSVQFWTQFLGSTHVLETEKVVHFKNKNRNHNKYSLLLSLSEKAVEVTVPIVASFIRNKCHTMHMWNWFLMIIEINWSYKIEFCFSVKSFGCGYLIFVSNIYISL